MNFGLAPEAPRPYYLRIAHQETEEISAPRTPENLVEPIAILSAVRTPIGRFLGSLSDVPAKDLGITAAKAALEQAGVDASEVGGLGHVGVTQTDLRMRAGLISPDELLVVGVLGC